jgi:hypothetical protein
MSQLTTLDANQVTKTVYDPNTQALHTVPAYVMSTLLLNAVPAGTSVTSSTVFFLPYAVMGIVATWSGLDSTDGTLQLEGSVDGSTWFNIGSAFTLSTASGSQDFNIAQTTDTYQDIRCVYTHGSNTVGTITVSYILRS